MVTKSPFFVWDLVILSGAKDLYASRKYSHHMARVLSCRSESLFVGGMETVSQSGVSTLVNR